MTIDELIERLLKANEPSRQLDEAVFEFVHGRKRRRSTFEQYDPSEKLPDYTKSIDAALTLRPDETAFVSVTIGARTGTVAVVAAAPYPEIGNHPAPFQGVCSAKDNVCEHPALAICIAALRARKDRMHWIEKEPSSAAAPRDT